jgi:hypothetical protein
VGKPEAKRVTGIMLEHNNTDYEGTGWDVVGWIHVCQAVSHIMQGASWPAVALQACKCAPWSCRCVYTVGALRRTCGRTPCVTSKMASRGLSSVFSTEMSQTAGSCHMFLLRETLKAELCLNFI